MKTLLIVGAVGLLVAGCGAQQQAAPGGSTLGSSAPSASGDALKGRVFSSQTVNEKGKPRPLVEGTQIRFEIADTGEMRVQAGCNHLFGQVDTSDARLAVVGQGLGQTEKGCAKTLMDQDTWLGDFISSKPGWQLDGDTLRLKNADTEIVFGPKPAASLEGPMWVKRGIVDNGEASGTLTQAWLSLNNGTALVTTECNTVEGSYQATSDKVTFQGLKSTGGSCPQADDVSPMLNGELPYRIDEETLTFTLPSGKGLQFGVGGIGQFLIGKDFVSADGKTKLSFKDGKLTATAGCNDMTGPVVGDNGRLVVQSLGKTRKACEPGLMEQEDKLAEFLKSLPEIRGSETDLVLKSGQTELTFKRQ